MVVQAGINQRAEENVCVVEEGNQNKSVPETIGKAKSHSSCAVGKSGLQQITDTSGMLSIILERKAGTLTGFGSGVGTIALLAGCRTF